MRCQNRQNKSSAKADAFRVSTSSVTFGDSFPSKGKPFSLRAHLLTTVHWRYPPASGRALSAFTFLFQSNGKHSVNLTRTGSGVSLKRKAEAIQPRLLTFGTNVLLAKPCNKAEKMRHLFYKLEFVELTETAYG